MSPAPLVEIVGREIAADASDNQRAELLLAITQNEEGVRREAQAVLADTRAGKVNSPVPVLLARLRKGQHQRDPGDERKRRHELTALDMAERRYRSHRSRYPHLGHTDSLEYAVDTTIIDHRSCPYTSPELEAALADRLKGTA
jgi:hypothetical protein